MTCSFLFCVDVSVAKRQPVKNTGARGAYRARLGKTLIKARRVEPAKSRRRLSRTGKWMVAGTAPLQLLSSLSLLKTGVCEI